MRPVFILFFTGSVPTPTLELGDLPSDEKIKSAEQKLKTVISSKDVDSSYDNWIKGVKTRSKSAIAYYFSKPIGQKTSDDSAKEINPLSYKPVYLWLDANDYNNTSGTWKDLSGNQNHAKRFASPKIVSHKPSGIKIVKPYHSSSSDYHEFKEIRNIRTVFG